MPTQNSTIRDGWTSTPGYAQALQSGRQVDEILGLLELSTAQVLADIGCGNGAFAVPAAAANPFCQVFAFDSLDAAITECRKRADDAGIDNLTAEVASADSVPVGDGKVDRVLSRNVLHHLSDASEAYAETARILADGGLFILEGPYNSGPEPVGEALTEIFRLLDESHVRHYHREGSIEQGLNAHGLRVESRSGWTFENRMPEGGVEAATRFGASEHLRVRERQDGVVTYELPIIRVIARKTGTA